MNSPTQARRKMDSVSIKVPYKHLKQNEVELVGFHGSSGQISPESKNSNGVTASLDSASPSPASSPSLPPPSSLKTLILGSMIAAGVQFGWALQLSLLTPYVQTLGIDHALSSFIWLCGPITGLVVQPCVGIWSDKCHSKYGRRRPFILVGSLMISVAVTVIGFSADIGYILGDTREHCSTYKGTRTMAAIIFVIGFWMLDLANNTVQGPARALLADLSGPDQKNLANATFASWMALGNILGFSAGANGNWHRWFPFLKTRACCEACGNLKAAFIVAVLYLALCTLTTLYFAKEVPLVNKRAHSSDSDPLLNGLHVVEESTVGSELAGTEKMIVPDAVHLDLKPRSNENEGLMDGPGAVLVNILTSMRHLPPAMHSVLTVMALTWLAWFPFFLFDTDWMGREVYEGDPKGGTSEVAAYDKGVREGAFGLLLNSVVLGISSFFIEPMCRQFGSRIVWAISNFMVFVCMASTAIISKLSENFQHIVGGNATTRIAALVLFALLGFPLSITYSVPFSLTAELTANTGGGQGLGCSEPFSLYLGTLFFSVAFGFWLIYVITGLAIGVLNLAIVIPQMIVSLGAGPWDALFGGGNDPAFVLASVFALVAGVVAVLKLPKLSSNSYISSGFHFA